MLDIDIDLYIVQRLYSEAEKIRKDYFADYYTHISNDCRAIDKRVLAMKGIQGKIDAVLARINQLECNMGKVSSFMKQVNDTITKTEKDVLALSKKLPDFLGSRDTGGYGSANERLFRSAYMASSGAMHGGRGRSFGTINKRGCFGDIDTAAYNVIISSTDAMLKKNQFPFAALNGDLVTTAKYLDDHWISYVKAYSTVSDIAQITGVLKEGNAFSEAVEMIGISKPLQNTIGYINTTSDYVCALKNGEYDKAAEHAVTLGTDIAIDAVSAASGIPGLGLVKEYGANIAKDAAEGYTEYWEDPSVETFGKLVFSTTVKPLADTGLNVGYDILEKVPFGNKITDYYEDTTGKTGAEAFYAAGGQLIEEVKQGVENAGGFTNYYINGVKLMVDGIKEKIQEGSQYVANGFKSIFT